MDTRYKKWYDYAVARRVKASSSQTVESGLPYTKKACLNQVDISFKIQPVR